MTKKKWDKDDLEHFKNVILEKRKKTIEEIKRLESITENNSGGFGEDAYSYHMADVGTFSQEREKEYLWLSREKKFLGHLNSALARIENGEYGRCIECGKLIPKERLEEVPHTQHCAECKK
jgi:RNA polymerase-binding protein DksA